MKRILKYRLPRDGETITINANVIKWLDIKEQNGWPHIWAVVDDEGYPGEYEFIAWGTGWDYPDELASCRYMGTAIDHMGYVWHYFMQNVAFVTGTTVLDNNISTLTTNCPLEIEPYPVTISCDDSGLTWNKVSTDCYTEAINTLNEVVKYLETSCDTASAKAYL